MLSVLDEKEEEFMIVIRICGEVWRKIMSLREGDVDLDTKNVPEKGIEEGSLRL